MFGANDPVWAEAKQVLITGGIRAGKTTRGAFKAFRESLNPKTKLIWLVGPNYMLAQEEFRCIFEWCSMLGFLDPNVRPSIPQDGVRSLTTKTGCVIETRSAQHPERLAAVAPDGIVLCEPGQMPGEIYQTVLGRLSQKDGWLFMCGTLEDDIARPRWAWYEKLAIQWSDNPVNADERSFTIPSWENRIIYPGGFDDPKLVKVRESGISGYKWDRMYGGEASGVENPIFPLLWEPLMDEELMVYCNTYKFTNGAIGVDYGRTFDHPSGVVVVQESNSGEYWIQEAWKGIRADVTEIADVVHSFQDRYKIYQGCVDPNQGILGDILGFQVALGGSATGKPSETRVSLVNGLLESKMLYFNRSGVGVQDVWDSMAICRRVANIKGELVYNRPIGDDLAQALMYAVECLRGGQQEIIPLDFGGVQMTYYKPQITGPRDEGRI